MLWLLQLFAGEKQLSSLVYCGSCSNEWSPYHERLLPRMFACACVCHYIVVISLCICVTAFSILCYPFEQCALSVVGGMCVSETLQLSCYNAVAVSNREEALGLWVLLHSWKRLMTLFYLVYRVISWNKKCRPWLFVFLSLSWLCSHVEFSKHNFVLLLAWPTASWQDFFSSRWSAEWSLT